MLKKKYTIYANCQGQALARVLNSSKAFTERYQYIEIKPVQEINRTCAIYQSTYKKLELKFENIPQYQIRRESLEIEDVIEQYLEFYKTIPTHILRANIRDWNLRTLSQSNRV